MAGPGRTAMAGHAAKASRAGVGGTAMAGHAAKASRASVAEPFGFP